MPLMPSVSSIMDGRVTDRSVQNSFRSKFMNRDSMDMGAAGYSSSGQ